MSELDLALRLVHILSAAVLFGTGLGTAYFMWRADRSGDIAAIAVTAGHVVRADYLFTAPAVVVQPLSGFVMAQRLGTNLDEGWLLLAIALYVVVGACWLPVVWLQVRARDLARAARAENRDLPPEYHRAMRLWFVLGWPAFISVIAIFALMVFKPDF